MILGLAGGGVDISHAQDGSLVLARPGILLPNTAAFHPPILKGIKVHPENPLRFEFMLDGADDETTTSAATLIKYFLAGITIPENDLWVNLSPYEKDRIVPDGFGQTDMGRDLLAQDYILKQMTASLMYPERDGGRVFWNTVYREAAKQYGNTQVRVNTFNKVWVVPEKAVVYESAQAKTAYVVESRLKVMLEEDYLAMNTQAHHARDANGLGSRVIRDVIIPQLTKEVNQGKHFARLRQVYNSLILATWYKQKLKDSILSRVYADRRKTKGIDIAGWKNETESIYQQYLVSFKKGLYNYVKEEPDVRTGEPVARKYFSGGMDFAMTSDPDGRRLGDLITRIKDWKGVVAGWGRQVLRRARVVSVSLDPVSVTPAPDAPLPRGVSAKEFVQAQTRLLRRVLLRQENEEEFIGVLQQLGIIARAADYDPQKGEEYHQDIYRKLSAAGYTPEAVEAIIGQTNADPRWDAVVRRQSSNPREHGILEAGANSIDALGGEIGQFGKGVKQIIAWLNGPQDRVDFFSLKDGAAHHLQATKAADGAESLQMMRISAEQFEEAARYPGAAIVPPEHGTVVRVYSGEAIALDKGVNSLRSLERAIHDRFATVRGIRIMTRVNKEPLRQVNTWEHMHVLAGDAKAPEVRGTLYFELTAHEIRIIDDGVGMDVQTISAMMVPSEGGTKSAKQPDGEADIALELARLALIHDRAPEKVARGASVAFVRRGEAIVRVPVAAGIAPDALLSGELLVELGAFLEVDPARNKLLFSEALGRGIADLVRRLMQSDGDVREKLKAVNALMAGLEFAAGGNDINGHMLDDAKLLLKAALAPALKRLVADGYVILPYQEGFSNLELGGHDKILRLNADIFDWQSYISLVRLGGVMIDPDVFHLVRNADGDKQDVMIVLMPFKPDALAGFARRDLKDLDFRLADRLPIIEGDDYVVIPAQWQFEGRRLVDLVAKPHLTDEERRSFGIQAQLISIVAGEGMTAYEIAGWKQTAQVNAGALDRLPRFTPSKGEVDSDAINGFLTNAPPEVPATPAAPGDTQARQLPAGAHLTYAVHNGQLVNLTDGAAIELRDANGQSGPPQRIEYVAGSYFNISFAGSDKRQLYFIDGTVAERVVAREKWPGDLGLTITPRRTFAYAFRGKTAYLLDLSSGKAVGGYAAGRIERMEFTEDEQYLFVEDDSSVWVRHMKKGRWGRYTKRPEYEIHFDRLRPVVHTRGWKESSWVSVNMWSPHPVEMKGPLFNMPEAFSGQMIMPTPDGRFNLHSLPHAEHVQGGAYSESEALQHLFGVEAGSALAAWLGKLNWSKLRPGLVSRHSHLEAVIYHATERMTGVRHLTSGEQWEFFDGGEVMGFTPERNLLVLRDGRLYTFLRDGRPARDSGTVLAVENAPHPRFCVVARGQERYLVRDGQEISLFVPPALDAVTFDGTYFVFSGEHADEVVYVNPDDAADIIRVPLGRARADIPLDARLRFYVDTTGSQPALKAIGSGERIGFLDREGRPLPAIQPLQLRHLHGHLYWIAEQGNPPREGVLYEIRGLTARRVLDDAVHVQPTPDGRFVYYKSRDNRWLSFYGTASQEPFRVMPFLMPPSHAVTFVSGDGRFVTVQWAKHILVVDAQKHVITAAPNSRGGNEDVRVDDQNSAVYQVTSSGKWSVRHMDGRVETGRSYNEREAAPLVASLPPTLRQRLQFDPDGPPGRLTSRVFQLDDGTSRDVLIDRREDHRVIVWDISSQHSFEFAPTVNVLKFYKEGTGFTFLVSDGAETRYETYGEEGQFVSSYPSRTIVPRLPGDLNVVLSKSAAGLYTLDVLNQRGQPQRLPWDAGIYSEVHWDGRYIVFLDPHSGQATYMDPAHPQGVRPGQGELGESTPTPAASSGIFPGTEIRYYVHTDGSGSQLRAIGAGQAVVFRNHAGQVISVQPRRLQPLGRGWYWVQEKGSAEGILYQIEGNTAQRVLEDGMHIDVSPDGKYLYRTSLVKGQVQFFESDSHETFFIKKGLNESSGKLESNTHFSKDGRYMIWAMSPGFTQVIDLQDRKIVQPWMQLADGLTVDVSFDTQIPVIYGRGERGATHVLHLGEQVWRQDGAAFNKDIVENHLAFVDTDLRERIHFDVSAPAGSFIYQEFPLRDGSVRRVFIDRREDNRLIVWDIASRRAFRFDGGDQILKFFEQEGKFWFLVRNGTRIFHGYFGNSGMRNQDEFRQPVTEIWEAQDYLLTYDSMRVGYDLHAIKEPSFPQRLRVGAQKYSRVSFDGKYFGFVDPQTGEVRYIDPAHPDRPVVSEATVQRSVQPHAAELWTDVLAHRDSWIGQARDAYFKLWEVLPESLRLRLGPALQERIGHLYRQQEEAVRENYREAVNHNGAQFQPTADLPFDIFAARTKGFISAWENLRKEEGGVFGSIDHLPPGSRDGFYSDFFHHAFGLLLHPEIMVPEENINAALVSALALGWEVRNERDLKNAGLITQLVDAVHALEGRPVRLETLQTMVRFLSRASASAERAGVVEGQLRRILQQLAPRARHQVLRQWCDAFEESVPADIYAGLTDADALGQLGRARDYVMFLTHPLDHMLARGTLEYPQGTRWLWEAGTDEEGVALDQIADFNAEKAVSRERSDDDLHSIEEIVKNIPAIRDRTNDRLRLFIAQAVRQQREPGAYTAEVEQNSADAGAQRLVVRHYFDEARKVYVEEMTDDGAGPRLGKALALLIPKSTKEKDAQEGTVAGYFGKGKFTMYRGVDEVEMVMNNKTEAYVLVLGVDSQARVFLKKVGVLEDPALHPTGVTIRRIMHDHNVLRELEQMLSIRAWKTFAGMAPSAGVTVAFQTADGLKPIGVKGLAMLGETDFVLHPRGGAAPVRVGKLRLWSTQDTDMPIQVVDKGGRRVDDLSHKDRFLDLVPHSWRAHVRGLRLVVQIPLPLIENRSAFVDEEELLPQIQQHIAAVLYKALVTKRLREESFFLDPVPRDFETNTQDSYDWALDPKQSPHLRLARSRHLFDLARDLSHKAPHELSFEELATVKQWFDGRGGGDAQVASDRQRAFTSFIAQVEVDIGDGHGPGSLLMRRIKAQSQDRPQHAQSLARATGVDFIKALGTYDPYAQQRRVRVTNSLRAQDAAEELSRAMELTAQEAEWLRLARSIAGLFGFEQVELVHNAPFAGKFVRFPRPYRMFLAADLAGGLNHVGSGHVGEIHEGTGTVVHELGHLFEAVADGRISALRALSTPKGAQDFTHDERFIRFCRLIAAMVLMPADWAQTASPVPSTSLVHAPSSPEGGIDFKADKMGVLRVDGKGDAWNMSIDPVMMRRMKEAGGFRPVIRAVRSLPDIRVFLGVVDGPASGLRPEFASNVSR